MYWPQNICKHGSAATFPLPLGEGARTNEVSEGG